MNRFLAHIVNNCLLYLLLIICAYLYFFHLDYSTLASWDEAWYASIAREMIRSKDFLHMIWDGKAYYDHPPMGFWLMAVTYGIFGISELTTRLPSAVLGLFTAILMYATGVRLFKRKEVGFIAALILATSVWYVLRVRSGNLDSIFVFFYVATIYTSVRASKDFRWFPVTFGAFACLLLTKTLVGASAIVLIAYMCFPSLVKARKNILYAVAGLIVFLIILLPWYYTSYKTYPDFIQHHFLEIGTRSKSFASYFTIMASQPLFYLHMGIRKWYYLWFVGLASLILTRKILKREGFFLVLWNAVILYPFLTSSQTQLWHLIPVYVPVAFITAYGIYELETMAASLMKRYIPILNKRYVLSGMYLLAFGYIVFVQIRIFHAEVITPYKYVADDVNISRSVTKYHKKTYLDDDYLPIAVYYSDRVIYPMYDLPSFGEDPAKKTLVTLFESPETDFVVITRSWAVNNLVVKNIPYKVLEKNNSFTILTKP